MITRYLKIYPDATNRLKAFSAVTRHGTVSPGDIGSAIRPPGNTGPGLPVKDLGNGRLGDTRIVWSYEI